LIEYTVFEAGTDYCGHLAEVTGLFERVFVRPFPTAGWGQWHLRNPYGDPLVIVGHDGSRLVAHHALTPQLLVGDGGRALPYMLSVSTMVDPGNRNSMAFTYMVKALHEAALARGSKFVLCLPNENSAQAFQILFRYRDLAESPLCTWNVDAVFPPVEAETISELTRDRRDWSYPVGETYWAWRESTTKLQKVCINGNLELVYKGPQQGVMTVLDMAIRSSGVGGRAALGGFARFLGATSVRLLELHARLAGVATDELTPHENYVARLMCCELSGPIPSIRFSLLLTDAF
jgi:hypothetical protein